MDAIHQIIVSAESLSDEQISEAPVNAAVPGASKRTRKAPKSGLLELIEAGLLPGDAALDCKLYGVTHAARVRNGEIELQGKTYGTPSAAAAALRGGKASNGWIIWRYKGETLADLRAKLTAGSQDAESPTAT